MKGQKRQRLVSRHKVQCRTLHLDYLVFLFAWVTRRLHTKEKKNQESRLATRFRKGEQTLCKTEINNTKGNLRSAKQNTRKMGQQ